MMISPTSFASLLADWLTIPVDQKPAWLVQHRDTLNLSFLEYARQQCADKIRTHPTEVDHISQTLFLIADFLADEPLAQAIACWARGIWAAYYDPAQAVVLYRRALHSYRPVGNPQLLVRLLSNIIPPLFDTGDFAAADQAYAEAVALQDQLVGDDRKYLLSLLQNYGVLLRRQGNYQEALAIHTQARMMAQADQQIYRMVELDVNRVLTLANMGQLTGSVALLQQSRQIAQEHGHLLTLARIDMNLGEIYTAQGYPAEALHHFGLAQQQFAQLHNMMEQSSVALREAALLERIGAWGEARQKYREVQSHFTQLNMREQVAHTLLRNATANRLYGGKRALREAQQLLEEAEQLWHELGHKIGENTVRLEKVAVMLARGDADQAWAWLQTWFTPPPDPIHMPLQHTLYHLRVAETNALRWQQSQTTDSAALADNAYQAVLAAGRQANDPYLQRQALAGLGRLKRTTAPHTARRLLEAAVQQDDNLRQALSVEELRAGFWEQSSDLLPMLVALAVQQGEPLAALRYTWQAKGSALLELLRSKEQTGHRINQPALSAVAIDTVRQELAWRRWQAIHHAAGNTPENLLEDKDPAIAHLMQRLQELRRQRNTKVEEGSSAAWQQPLQLLQTMEADVLIEYICCDDQLLAMRAERSGACRAVWLGAVTEIEDQLGELESAFQILTSEHWAIHLAESLQECLPHLFRLYQCLWAPLGPFRPASHLLIAPCAPLHTLAFAMLWNGERYLVEDFVIEQIVTGGLLAMSALPNATGSPLLIAASANGKLPATQSEVEAIQSVFPNATVLIDEPETIAYLQNLHEPPRFLHLAAHTRLMNARANASALIFRALHLPGGLLSLEQCFDLPLHGCELVTLSGCLTAAGMDSGGALLAFQSAFLLAGAQRVLTALWSIPDAMAGEWMRLFYQFLATGDTPVLAVRRTQLAWLRLPAYAHPVLWAAYVVNRR